MVSESHTIPVTEEEYYQRLAGIASPALRNKVVLAVGCGGGSYALEKLSRYGVHLRLTDGDRVGAENLCRTNFRVEDLDEFKTDALQRRIGEVNPFVQVESVPSFISRESDWRRLLDGVDLIIAGTDSFDAQALLNRVSQANGIPIVFIGVHARGEGGRIIYSLPGITSCYRSVARERYAHFETGGTVVTDLNGVAAGLVDIQFIDMVALKVVLGLLERGEDSELGRFGDLLGERNEIILRTTPAYAFGEALWDAVLGDLPTAPRPYAQELKSKALFSLDTLWLRTEPCPPECPDCALYTKGKGR